MRASGPAHHNAPNCHSSVDKCKGDIALSSGTSRMQTTPITCNEATTQVTTHDDL